MSVVGSVIVSDIVPLKSRGLYQGCTWVAWSMLFHILNILLVANMLFALGAAIGAPFGGWLGDAIGWYDSPMSFHSHTLETPFCLSGGQRSGFSRLCSALDFCSFSSKSKNQNPSRPLPRMPVLPRKNLCGLTSGESLLSLALWGLFLLE